MTRIRAAAHVHSDWSYDGRWSLPDIATRFRRMGYDVVLMAEHDRGYDEGRWREYQVACAAAGGRGILLVPGIEYSDAANDVHVAVWGEQLPFLGEGRDTLDLLAEVRSRSGTSMLAHAARRNVHRRVTREWLDLLDGIELWNAKYDGWTPSPHARELLDRDPATTAYVGLDFHTARQLLPLAMVGELPGEVSRETAFAALRSGELAAEALGRPAEWAETPRGVAFTAAAERARKGAGRAARRAKVRAGSR